MSYSLSLTIADIPIQLHCHSAKQLLFLRQKYKDYLNLTYKQNSKKCFNNSIIHYPERHISFLSFNMYLRNIVCSILGNHNGLLLHGSVLILNNQGYIFIGAPGAGKSTIRKLFSNYTCLGDDTAVVRKIQNIYYVFGSPFYQKTNMAYPNIKTQLKNIYFLKHANKTTVRLSRYSDALAQLAANAFVSTVGNHSIERAKTLNLATDIINSIPIYTLSFEKNRKALEAKVFNRSNKHI